MLCPDKRGPSESRLKGARPNTFRKAPELAVAHAIEEMFCATNHGIEKERVDWVAQLNRMLESELAGVIRYTHYSFLVYGYNRMPIVSWLREQTAESLNYAQPAGEMFTHGGYPSPRVGRSIAISTISARS